MTHALEFSLLSCVQRLCNVGQGAPSWAIHQKKRARDEKVPPSWEAQAPAQESTSAAAMDTAAAAATHSAAAAAPPQATSAAAAAIHLLWTCPMAPHPDESTWPSPMLSCTGSCAPMGQEALGAWTPSPMQTIHEEHVPNPGKYISGNLWNLNLRSEVLEQAGPLGSFMRHTTSMATQTSLVMYGQWPVRHLRDFARLPEP